MHRSRMEIVSATGSDDVATVFVAHSKTHPERMFEFVDGLDDRYSRDTKWIINISTQYGCPVSCLFCDAGGGFQGNIPAELMLEQIRAVLDRHAPDLRLRCEKLKVHFSRMGEPALNPHVLDVLEELPRLIPTPHLWACVATIVPAGTGEWFASLARLKRRLYPGRFQIQFSVNSTDEQCRAAMMPFPHAALPELVGLGASLHKDGDRKIALNVALAHGVPVEAEVIEKMFDPRVFMVKLTPLNPMEAGRESGMMTALLPASPGSVDSLVQRLVQSGFDVVVSIGDPREDEIGSNCGQAVRRFVAAAGAGVLQLSNSV